MKSRKVRAGIFNDYIKGDVIFELHGKNISYDGLLERLGVDGTYVPKLHVHEKSDWCLIFVRPWMDCYTLYYGNYMNTEAEAREFLAGMKEKLQRGVSVEEIVQNGFQDAFRYSD
jgi:hypothetical protein